LDTRPPDAVETPAGTPTSICIALFCFAFAIGAPIYGLMSVRDSHDGFQILGTFLISAAIGGFAALIGIICTIVGAVRGQQTGWTLTAGILSFVSIVIWLAVLAKM
jgi:hypothetical protein